MASLAELTVSIVGDVSNVRKAFDELGKGVDNVGTSLTKLGTDMRSMGTNLTMSVTAPIVAMGAGIVIAANQVDDAYDTIRVGTGATGDALLGLQEDFHAVFGEVPASAQEVGTAIADLNTRLGLTGEPLQQMSTQFLELSRITGTDVATNIEQVTRVFGDWGVAADEQSEKLDYLFKVSQATGIGIDQLSTLMVQYGAPLRQMGFDYDTAAAMIGKFNKEGVNTELVMGSMRIALGKMAQEGITDANEALEIIIERIKEAGSVGEANAIAIEMFGARAGPDMAAAIREGRFEIEGLVTDLNNSSDSIITAANDTKDLNEMLSEMKAKVIEAVEPLGTSLRQAFESLEPALDKVIGFLASAIEWFTNLPGPVQAVVAGLVALAAAIGPVLIVAGTLVASVGAITTALGAAGLGGALATVVGILTGPVAIAIAAFAAAAYIVYKNWDTVGPLVQRTFDTIVNAVRPTAEVIMDFVNGACASLSAWWSTNGPAIAQAVSRVGEVLGAVFGAMAAVIWYFTSGPLKGLWEAFQQAVNIIIPILQYIGQQVGNMVMLVVNLINGDWSGAWTNARNIVSAAWEAIKSIVSGGLNAILGFLVSVLNSIYSTIQNVWNSIRSYISGAMNAVSSSIASGWNNIRSAIIAAMGTISTAISGGWNAIRTLITGAMSQILTAVTSGWNNVRTAVTNAMNNINSGISTGWNTAKTVVSNGVSGIVSTVSSFGSSLYTAGANLVQSVINGIASKIQDLKNKINELFNLSKSSDSGSSSGGSGTGKAVIVGEKSGNKVTGISGSTYNTPPREKHDTGGIAGYTGWHWMERGELAIPQQTNWDQLLVKPIVRALTGSSSGSVSAGNVIIQNMPVTLTSGYNFEQLMSDIEKYNSQKRFQRGISL